LEKAITSRTHTVNNIKEVQLPYTRQNKHNSIHNGSEKRI
ncbi:15612_t:CDS:1, partial [Dentiscutata erythropus]